MMTVDEELYLEVCSVCMQPSVPVQTHNRATLKLLTIALYK